MRVGWLPGRLSGNAALDSMPGLEVIPLDPQAVFNPPEIVVLDEVEADIVVPWLEHPIVVIFRSNEPLPHRPRTQALVFQVAPESAAREIQRTLLHAEAAVVYLRQLRQRLTEVQQRLSDRILVEKAKGLLTQRFGLSEDEAYRRMRLQSRQERRPMREIAEAVLTSAEILPQEVNRMATVTV